MMQSSQRISRPVRSSLFARANLNKSFCKQLNTSPFALSTSLSNKTLLIDGELKSAISKETFDVQNPATRHLVAKASRAGAADVDAAVTSSKKAQEKWAKLSTKQRAKYLYDCANLLEKHANEIAELVTLETGKAIRTESRVEANLVPEILSYHAGLALEIKGETIPYDPSMLTYTVREPLGVVAAIIPWNAPLLLMALKIAPALVTGNTVVVKSAEQAPLAVAYIAQLMNSVLPPGVFNMISGFGAECGSDLIKHPHIAKVTFTGSVPTGKFINSTAANKLIPVTLELGGKSPMVVCEDADLSIAIDGAINGMRFTRQGQSCTASSRIFVHEKVHDEFVNRLVEKVNKLKMGDPLHESTDMGTLISEKQFDRVLEYIKEAENTAGVVVHRCCEVPTDEPFKNGLFIQPAILTNLDTNHRCAKEEIFGPVACIFKWSDFDEVIRQANESEYGLAATIWTRNLGKAMAGVSKLDAGIVQVNQNLVVRPSITFGGFKSSGLGKEASLSSMLNHYTREKTIIINMNS